MQTIPEADLIYLNDLAIERYKALISSNFPERLPYSGHSTLANTLFASKCCQCLHSTESYLNSQTSEVS